MGGLSQTKRHWVRRGSTVLDLALVMPMFLSLAFGTVEYGYYFFVKNTLQGAAREGVRRAIVPGASSSNITSAVNQVMTAAGFSSGEYSVSVLPAGWTTAPAGTDITVTVSATWGSIGVEPLPDALGGISSSKVLSGTTVMRSDGTP